MSSWKLTYYKITNWEYWPFWCVYYPLFPFWLYYAIKARSFYFFSACNPSIENGGMVMESKMDIYKLIPQKFYPKTILAHPQEEIKHMLDKVKKAEINFPFIVKPDIGMKSFAVAKIKSESDLETYRSKIDVPFLIQELIPYEKEAGIFYVRLPEEKTGKITGIVTKEFLKVTGNGKDSILQLIKQNNRASLQLNDLKTIHGDTLCEVLPMDKIFILMPFGSHTRGSKFIDDSHKITQKLNQTIDTMCQQIDGFFYGRIDIRFRSFKDLENEKNFSVIEVNGSGAEPTHMYDPKHSIFKAWQIILNQWDLMYKTASQNKKRGHNYLNFKTGWSILSQHKALEKKLRTITM